MLVVCSTHTKVQFNTVRVYEESMRDDWCTFLVLRLLFCMVVFLVTTSIIVSAFKATSHAFIQ